MEKDLPELNDLQVILPDPRYFVTFHFAQFANNKYVAGYFAKTFGTYRGDIDALRAQMLKNKYWDSLDVSSDCHLWYESTEPFLIVVKDQDNVLPWLFPNMDLAEFFNQKPEHANEPLRLPSVNP